MNESAWVKQKFAVVTRSEWLPQPLFRVMLLERRLEDGIFKVGGVLDE